MRFIRNIVLLASLLTFATVAANPFGGSRSVSLGGAGEPAFLPVDEAFVFEALVEQDKVQLNWRMPEGYYLYRHRLLVPGLSYENLPEGLQKFDEIFGDVEVYYKTLQLTVPTASFKGNEIVISYQGCADAGLCYPPQKRTVRMN